MASIKSPHLPISTPKQNSLVDLTQNQLISDDCDSGSSATTTTLNRNNLLSPMLNTKTNNNNSNNFNDTSNTSNKSILNEINIDELFIYYPNVFEELFYSANNPFKLNSIEQIEHDLRSYCEQQFKLNLNNQSTTKDTVNNGSSNSNPTNQQFSIRI